MSESMLSMSHLQNEEAAYAFFETRIWPKGAVCPHCGGTGKNKKMGGTSTRIGLYKCYDCRSQFTVKGGTIFESSHLKLHICLQAIYLIASSKKGISANQLHRTLGVTLKTAWFLGHRIREAMREGSHVMLGGEGAIVEADEPDMGPKRGEHRCGGGQHRVEDVLLVQLDGKTSSLHVANVDIHDLRPILMQNNAKDSHLKTGGTGLYRPIGKEFDNHEWTDHRQNENARPSRIPGVTAHSNTVNAYFAILKRGIVGTYYHLFEHHLQRYLNKFDFRYSNCKSLGVKDFDGAVHLMGCVTGKRLTCETTQV